MADDVFDRILEQLKKGNELNAKLNTSFKDAFKPVPKEEKPAQQKAKDKAESSQSNKLLGRLVDINKKMLTQHPALAALGNFGSLLAHGRDVVASTKIGGDGASLGDHFKKFTGGNLADRVKTSAENATTKPKAPIAPPIIPAVGAATEATEAATAASTGFAASLIGAIPVVGQVAIGAAIVTAGLGALAAATVLATRGFLESQKVLAKYNGTLAAAYAQARVRTIQRDIESGKATANATAKLVDAYEGLKDAWAPISNAFTNLASSILTPLVQVMTGFTQTFGKVVAPLIDVFSTFANVTGSLLNVFASVGLTVFKPILGLMDSLLRLLKPLLDTINRGVDAVNALLTKLGVALPQTQRKSILPGELMFQNIGQGKLPRQNKQWQERGRLGGKRTLIPPSK